MSEAKHWDGPGLEAWEAWTPDEAAAVLKGVDAPWCVVGGWAIDLFLERETRKHDDLEIAIPRVCLPAMRSHLTGYRLHAVGDGEVHRLGAVSPFPAEKHQCWVLDEEAGKWRMDVMSEPGDALKWVCRRDETINAPREWMTAKSQNGIPYLVPEAVLLFKAKYAREKDEADFTNCLPELSAPARDWLRNALHKVHPDHAWLEKLS
jgi:hypothetical protein